MTLKSYYMRIPTHAIPTLSQYCVLFDNTNIVQLLICNFKKRISQSRERVLLSVVYNKQTCHYSVSVTRMHNLKNRNDKYFKIKMKPFLAIPFKHKIVILTTVALLYSIVVLILINTWFFKSVDSQSLLTLDNVIVHFDFKGSPPKMSYLKTLLPKFKELGVTGLLMEYEDMFPYEDKLMNLSASSCYEKSELFEFVSLAVQSGFEIIPLIQTFGHMEHVLKLKQFQHLREEPLYPDSICPSRVESQDLIKKMIEQVATFHNDIAPLRHFHIGCDEVYHINKCHLCTRRGLKDIEIFVKHVKIVTNLVKKINPNTTVLIWDDGLRDVPIYKWDHYIKNLSVEPVYWDYRPSLPVSHVSLMKYYYSFHNIWIASAYKGADGRVTTFPDIKKRFLNNFSWLSIINNYKFGGMPERFTFKGIILTGWSRYSHMDSPCELLHNAIPSLFLNLLLIKHFKENGYSDADNELNITDFFNKYLKNKFNNVLECNKATINYIDTSLCKFDGKDIYRLHLHLNRVITDVKFNINDEVRGLSAIDFYSKTHYINLNNVYNDLEWTNTTIKDLSQIEHRLRQTLLQYYDVPFVTEYLHYKLYNCKKTLFNLSTQLKDMLNVRTWDRRP